MKIYTCLLSFLILFLSLPLQTYAASASSPCVVTKVGNPSISPVLPPECSNGSSNPGGKPPDYPSDLRQAIINKFTIVPNGFDELHLKWLWEEFWSISNTKFFTLVKGSVVVGQGVTGYSQQVGCAPAVTVRIGQYAGEDIFKFLITHELGHAIRNCNPRAVIKYNEHINAFENEGAVSYYGGHAAICSGSDNYSEDYADSVAYYLNRAAGLASGGNGCGPQAPANPFFSSPAVAPRKDLHYTNVMVPVLQ